MNSSELQLDVIVSDSGSDAERLDDLTIRLMRDLRELCVEPVERPSGGAIPEGAKGEPFTIGALVLAVIPAILPKIVEFLQAWLQRGAGRTVNIKTPTGVEVEFTPDKKMSEDELLALVERLTQIQAPGALA